MATEFFIPPKEDHPLRLIELNGVPQKFWLSAEEINSIIKFLAALLGQETSLYKGEFESLQHLEAEHPLPEPGSEAQIIVVDGSNLKASWDNTNKKWFLDGIWIEPGSDAAYLLKSIYDPDGDGVVEKAKDLTVMLSATGTKYYGTKNGVLGVHDLPTGGSAPATGIQITYWTEGWKGGFEYHPFLSINVNGIPYTDSRDLTVAGSDPVLHRSDLFAFNLQTNQLAIIPGTPGPVAVEPSYDPMIYFPIRLITIPAGSNSPEGLASELVYNGEEVGWDMYSHPSYDFESTNGNPSGNYCMEVVGNLSVAAVLPFTAPDPLPFGTGLELVFKIKNITPGGSLYIPFTGADKKGKTVRADIVPPNYDPNSLEWQLITIPLTNSRMINLTAFYLGIRLAGGKYFLDDVHLITGGGATSTDYVTRAELDEALADFSTSLSILDKDGVEQFKVEDAVRFEGVEFEPATKKIKVKGKLKEIVVQDKSQLTGELRSDVVYILDGAFTLVSGEHITIPTGGLTLTGYGFDVSQINKNVAGQSIFRSPAEGSGNLILKDTQYTSGAGSVFNIVDTDGEHAIEFNDINFSGCASLGKITGYRQFTGTTCGVYGCSDGVQLSGEWNGFKLTNTNSFTFGASGSFFKRDVDTLFTGRFYIEMNLDFPMGAVLADFSPANFADKELFQINSTIAKVDGVIDDAHAATLLPNIKANDEKCLWRSNVGLPDSALEKFVNDDDIAGIYNINWLKDTYFLTMTADTTFTESNLPANLKNTEEIKIYLQGNFTPTFPAAWNLHKVGTYKGGEINQITLKFIKTGVYFMKIDNSLTVYPAPSLQNIEPASLLPSQTQELIINGSFFTPATIVSIEGQVVNSVEFVNQGKLILSVTTGNIESEFDISISNGTTVNFNKALIINLGVVYIPSEPQWTIGSGSIDITEKGSAKILALGVQGIATWNQIIDFSKPFEIRHKVGFSNLNPDPGTTSSSELFYIEDENSENTWGFHYYTYNAVGTAVASQFVFRKNGSHGGTHNASWDRTLERIVRIVWNPATEQLLFYSNNHDTPTATILGKTMSSADGFNNTLQAKIKVQVQRNNYVDIKYIELPT